MIPTLAATPSWTGRVTCVCAGAPKGLAATISRRPSVPLAALESPLLKSRGYRYLGVTQLGQRETFRASKSCLLSGFARRDEAYRRSTA